MFAQLEVTNMLAAFIGAGGLAAMAATLTKYLLDRRKMDGDYDSGLLGKLQQRIDELETKERECMERNAEMAKLIGYLEAKVESLESQLGHCETDRIRRTKDVE